VKPGAHQLGHVLAPWTGTAAGPKPLGRARGDASACRGRGGRARKGSARPPRRFAIENLKKQKWPKVFREVWSAIPAELNKSQKIEAWKFGLLRDPKVSVSNFRFRVSYMTPKSDCLPFFYR
jgi:hypothetical protein